MSGAMNSVAGRTRQAFKWFKPDVSRPPCPRPATLLRNPAGAGISLFPISGASCDCRRPSTDHCRPCRIDPPRSPDFVAVTRVTAFVILPQSLFCPHPPGLPCGRLPFLTCVDALPLQITPLAAAIVLAVGFCGYSLVRNLSTNPDI